MGHFVSSCGKTIAWLDAIKRYFREEGENECNKIIWSFVAYEKKTGKPFVVNEMNYDDFFDLKSLEENMNFNMTKNNNGDVIKTGDIKSIKFTKNCLNYEYRTTYKTQNWEVATKKITRQ